jgi:Cu2+-exporting ATPase
MQRRDYPSAQRADHQLPATSYAPGADSTAKATEERAPTAPQAHPHMPHGHPGAPDAPASHHGHAAHGEEMFKRPFWVAFILTIPILVYAEHTHLLLGYTAPAFLGSRWLEPLLASVIYWYCGWVFLRGAIAELRARQPGMMTLVALAITTAYYYSLAATFGVVLGMPFYWELATLVTIMLLGH